STREALQALANRDIYAKLKPRPLVKPEHTPSTTNTQSSSNQACRSRWESARSHTQSSESSESSDNTPPDKIPDSLKLDDDLYMNKSLPRWERRRMQKAYKKLKTMQLTQ
ncbi:MAG: hypothetical protein K2J74_06390, partial [Muribaculaceae bacterium]|nr:hypothetical protein [Muribaculaceae bacterium]